MGWGFSNRAMIFKNFTVVFARIYFATNIFLFLLCETECVWTLGLQISEVEGGDHFLNICTGRRTKLETAMKIALYVSPRIG